MEAAGVNGPDRDSRLRQIDKLVASETLHGSESLCNLLKFLARKSIENPGVSIKEYQIATEVFGRSADFDPRLDSTVRVQTGRLRSKLMEYYANGGADDRVMVEVPKGSYSLVFHQKAPVEPPRAEPPRAAEAPAPVASARPSRTWWLLTGILGVGLALTLASNVRWGKASANPSNALNVFWQRFLESPDPPLVVYSNAAFVGRPETGLRYFNPATDAGQPILDHYTGVGEVMAIHEIDRVFVAFRRDIRVKRGRLLTWDDAKAGNLIFIGSPSENLSLRELPGPREFVFKVMDSTVRKGDLCIVNVHPRPNEELVYVASGTVPVNVDYAVVGLIPGLSANRWVLVLAGTTTLGTQAAVEFVCRPKSVEEMLARSGVSSGAPIVPFEAVVRARISGGVPVQSELVALHSQPGKEPGR